MEYESLVNDNAIGISAVGDGAEMRVRKVVRESKVLAELFLAGQALGTGPVGVDHAADRRQVPGLEIR